MRGRNRQCGIVLLVAYLGYDLNPLFHDVFEHVEHLAATASGHHGAAPSVLTPGCPEHCNDPSHRHRPQHSEHCPACQLAATWFAPTLMACHLHVTDAGCSLVPRSEGNLTVPNPCSADPIRGPPLPPSTSVIA